MGASASKQPETKVFTPSSPVEFSQDFLSKLEGSEESNFARAQYGEKFINKQVGAKLKELQKDADKNLDLKIVDSIIPGHDSDAAVSTKKLDEKIESLTTKLEQINKHKYFQDRLSKEHKEELAAARGQVVACLKDNKDKPLNCWDEVQKFRTLVKEL